MGQRRWPRAPRFVALLAAFAAASAVLTAVDPVGSESPAYAAVTLSSEPCDELADVEAEWQVDENDGAIAVSDGLCTLDGGPSTSTFPYVRQAQVLPVTGDFTITVRLGWRNAGPNGTGFVADQGPLANGSSTPDPATDPALVVWQDQGGFYLRVGDSVVHQSTPVTADPSAGTGFRTVVLDYRSTGTAWIMLDGAAVGSFSGVGRPSAMWFGNPTVANSPGDWSDLYLDDVTVTTEKRGVTTRESVDSNGTQSNCGSHAPSISGDGRYVAFDSIASDLVPGDTNASSDVFVHDRETGATIRVSVDSAGREANDGSLDPAISGDGRFVAFVSSASNLVAGDDNRFDDVFVHDREAGTTTRVSVDSAGGEGDWHSLNPSVSADGRYVAFDSPASNLVLGDTNMTRDVFVHDRQSGTTTRVSVSSQQLEGNGNGSYRPSISADGRFVAFYSYASNLVSLDTNGEPDVFVRDRAAGTTTLVSVDSSGVQGVAESWYASISADGRYVAFQSDAPNLVLGDSNLTSDVFVRDTVEQTTALASASSNGVPGDDASLYPSISGDGRYVSFVSRASNLVAGDTNDKYDVFVRDRITQSTTRVSVDSAGAQAHSTFVQAAVSAEGRYVAFESSASNLVAGDTNTASDVFVRDRGEEDAPSLSDLAATPTSISPDGDGTNDSTVISAALSDDSPPIDWTLQIRGLLGAVIQSWSGSGTTVSETWDGTDGSGSTVPDGNYTAQLVARDFWGNPASASVDVVVDRTPPAIVGTTPIAFASVTDLPYISATLSDALSVVSTASTVVTVDGVPRSITVESGAGTKDLTVRADTAGIAPGVHLVEIVASDRAGNTATDEFLFTLATIAADAAQATLQGQTVEVNPQGDLVGPSEVVFDDPQVEIEGFAETLNASTRVGYGTITRPFGFGSVQVRFDNGLTTETVTVPIPAANAPHDLAILAPSGSELRTTIDPSTVTLADLPVDVPLGYNTQGSTATILPITTPLGPPVATEGHLAPEPPQGQVPVIGEFGVCMEQGDVAEMECTVGQVPRVWARIGGQRVPTLIEVEGASDPSPDASPPSCSAVSSGGGCIGAGGGSTTLYVQDAAAGLALGCPYYEIPGLAAVNLCTGGSEALSGFLSAYVNAWTFLPTEGGVAVWRQDHVEAPPEGASCGNGATTGQVTASAHRVAVNNQALDLAAVHLVSGTFRPRNEPAVALDVMLGDVTGPDQLSGDDGAHYDDNTGRGYRLRNEMIVTPLDAGNGAYTVLPAMSVDGLGTRSPLGSSVVNLWEHSSEPIATGPGTQAERLQMSGGTEFGSSDGYAVQTTLAFQYVVDYGACPQTGEA